MSVLIKKVIKELNKLSVLCVRDSTDMRVVRDIGDDIIKVMTRKYGDQPERLVIGTLSLMLQFRLGGIDGGTDESIH